MGWFGRSDQSVPEMLTRDQLTTLDLNEETVQFALDRADKMLVDVLEVRKSIEAKAQQLFTSYVTISLAIIGAMGVLSKSGLHVPQLALVAAVACFALGAILFILTIGPADYGYLGTSPCTFLQPDIINGSRAQLLACKATVLHSYEKRIQTSSVSNGRKIDRLRYGMWAGIAGAAIGAPVMFFV